jgi:outer membrane protein assembly factor BamD
VDFAGSPPESRRGLLVGARQNERRFVKHLKTLSIAVLACTLLAGCLGKKKAAPVAGTSAEPDKVLYSKATDDIKHGKYTVGRLGLQTLINTYPDSEYLAKAKLGIGDSYYKEGGMAGLKQSIVEYKDFITFFPFLDEAAYAQMQIAMGHYRQMEKPDRDHSEVVQAEAEFQTFLEKYPNSPLVPGAEQHLREVQEVLAEGNFRVAEFYYIRNAYKAAGARLLELVNRYPLYSEADRANWMLGQIYEKTEHTEIAARYYARIVKHYPQSSLTGEAKARLT